MKLDKVQKLAANLHDKTEQVIHIRNHGRILEKKVHRVINYNQKARRKSYTDMNTKLRQKAKKRIEKIFFKNLTNAVFRKTMENERKHRNINDRKEQKLFSMRTKLS